jgi:hypothetical protein
MMGKGRILVAVAACAAVLSGFVAAYAEDATYVSNKQCKICHNSKDAGEIWNAWKASNHAKALELLSTDPAKEVAKQKGITVPPAEAPECLACHVTGFDAATKTVSDKLAKEDGVQCESCHGPASLHMADGKKFKATKDPAIKMSEHIVKGDEATCKKCHNDTSPTWKADCYTLEDGSKAGFDFKQAWAKIAHKKGAAK